MRRFWEIFWGVLAALLIVRACGAQQIPRDLSATLLIVDWAQADEAISHHAGLTELNVLIGPHPSVGRVNTYGVAVVVADLYLVPLLPRRTRTAVWWFVSGLEAAVVTHQWRLGLRLDL